MRHPGKVLVTLVSVLVLIVTGFAWQQVDSLRSSLATAGGLDLGDGKDGAVDILMVGIDSRTDAQGNPLSQSELDMLRAGEADATNTDTIILIRIPNDGSSATAVSIPRDSYVQVPGLGMSKINAAYGETKALAQERLVEEGVDPAKADAESTKAGRHALLRAVADLTGITVDHYAEVGLLGFVLLTNAVGGVPVCLNAPVYDPYSGADFPAGPQTLDGADALSFVRQRHGLPRGDLDRIVRQQSYLASLAQEVLSADMLASPAKLNQLNSAVQRSVVVDSGWDIVGFARRLQDLSAGAVTFQTIPVQDPSGTSPDGESIVEIDPSQVHSFFEGLVDRGDGPEEQPADDGGGGSDDSSDSGDSGGSGEADDQRPLDVVPGNVTVDVLNSSAIGGLASSVSEALGSVGYGAGQVANYTGTPPAASQVRTAPASRDAATAVARALGGLDVVTDDAMMPGTVTVVLADQYAGPGSGSWSGTLVSGTDGVSGSGGPSASGGPATGGGQPGQATTQPGADHPVGPAVSADDGVRCVN
ncbi:LCP family protein [Tomitella cavernea]|uniref:LCP family protein n=1 Tax=Tomitella cavernea TaxID=1387982 RepID=UPI003557B27E